VIFMSSEYMNHAGALAAFSSGLLFFGRAVRAGRVRDGIAAGVAFGVLALIRPLTAVALVAPLFSFWVYRIVASRTGRLAPFAAAVGSGALVASMLLPYNAATTGDPWRLGYQVVFGSGVGPGFGRVGRGSAHTVATGLVHTGVNLVAAEKAVFEWPLPSVIFVGALLASGRVVAWDAALGASAIGLALAYLTYFYQDLCFGPRFLYEATAVVCVLTARGLVEGVRRFRGTEPEAARRAVALLAALVVWALAVPVPNLVRLYSADYMGGTSRAVDAVRAAGVGNALVFVRSFYPSAFSQNAPTLDGDVVYAQDLPDRERLMRAYPGRTAFLEDGGRLQPLSPLRGTGLAR
jgi:hypothetical protein